MVWFLNIPQILKINKIVLHHSMHSKISHKLCKILQVNTQFSYFSIMEIIRFSVISNLFETKCYKTNNEMFLLN